MEQFSLFIGIIEWEGGDLGYAIANVARAEYFETWLSMEVQCLGLRSGLKIMTDFLDERVAEVASDYDGQAV